VICVTGSILVFRGDIQRILYPNLFYSNEKGSPTVHIATAVEKVKAAFPDHKLLGLEGPAETHDTFLGYIEKDQEIRSVFANPTTGDALGTLPDDDALRWLQDLHFYLLSGRRGLVINGLGALLLFLLSATGLVIWWPGIATWPRSLKIDFRNNWKRVNWDIHSATGIWSVALIAMWAITGAYFAFPQYFRTAVTHFSALTSYPQIASKSADAGRTAVGLHQLVDKALQTLPEARVTRVSLPRDEKDSVTVVMSRGAATEFENGNYVYFYFDQFTGELLHKWDRAGQTAGDQIMSWIGFLHVGNFGGVPIQILWAILGLSPALLFVTGFLMWWNRVVREKWRRSSQKPNLVTSAVGSREE
jgi:uncharacterized iron-regulated membrane protein